MNLTFSYQYSNLLIILIGIVLLFYLFSRRLSKKRVITFGNFEVLEKVTGRKILTPSIIPLILRILALFLIIISISNPKLTYMSSSSDTDYVLAIDTSSSMLTPDLTPNRLEVAKDISSEFIKSLENTKIGIVTFAGKAYTKTGLTDDTTKLELIIDDINVETPAGTAIGDAIITSTSLLAGQEDNKNKTIILITDGRNNVGVPLNQTIETLKSNHIKVYTIGIGGNISKMNITMPSEMKEKNATVAEFPNLDENTLKYIANQTGGQYFRVTDVQSFRDALKSTIKQKRVTIQPTFYLLLSACIVLLIEWSLEVTKYRILP